MNSCNFMGRFVKDPDLKDAHGVDVIDFTLAINEYRKSKDGSKTKTVDFLDFVAWDSGAATIAKHCKKGDRIALSCSARQEKWEDKTGSKRSAIKFRVNKFYLLSSAYPSEENHEEKIVAVSDSI
jgi:single stranded DNA-binding protein